MSVSLVNPQHNHRVRRVPAHCSWLWIRSASAEFCRYHVGFCPKYRRSVLVNGVDVRLKEIITETVVKRGQELIELDVLPDHVHLLLRCDPQFGIHRLARYIKGTTSHHLSHEFPDLKRKLPSLLTNSTCYAMVGNAPLELINH